MILMTIIAILLLTDYSFLSGITRRYPRMIIYHCIVRIVMEDWDYEGARVDCCKDMATRREDRAGIWTKKGTSSMYGML